jgi:hypothetical protein
MSVCMACRHGRGMNAAHTHVPRKAICTMLSAKASGRAGVEVTAYLAARAYVALFRSISSNGYHVTAIHVL